MLTAAGAVKQANNQRSAEEWEIAKVGDFLLGLYHQQLISPRTRWRVPKQRLWQEFHLFLNKAGQLEEDLREKLKQFNNADIGRLLYRTGFLNNTQRGSDEYLINNAAFFRYSNKKLEEYDEVRRNGEITELFENSLVNESYEREHDLEDCFKVDEDATVHKVAYQGSNLQDRKDNFTTLTDKGCYICQENYENLDIFEEHVEFHGNESDFEFLKTLKKTEMHVWSISYRECQNSHYFCFTMETEVDELLVIEKIIVVQSRSMYYVHNSRVPYAVPSDGKVKFFVDSRLFRTNLEQPIVIVFHEVDKKNKRWIEEHHFMRTEQLPKVIEDNNPRRLPNKTTFKAKISIPQYLPSAEVRAAFDRDDVAIEPLCVMSNEFKDYMQNGKELTRENVRPVLNVLLQIEDWTIIRVYKDLVQRQVTLRCIGNEYSLFLKTTKKMYFENVLSQYDEVLIIAESSEVDTSKQEELTMDLLVQNTDDLKNQCEKAQGKRKTYFGQVDRYVNGRVVFTCKKLLPKNKTFTLIFRPARLVTRYQFRALELLAQLSHEDFERFFFPGVVTPTDCFKLNPQSFLGLKLQNKGIYNNPEQLQAVHYISKGPSREAPYIVFGPPGTGKTTTLVEAIYQLYTNRPFTKILLTAGSNGACDEIARRLCRILSQEEDTRAIVRIYSKSCEERADGIDKDLLKASNMYSSQFYPDIDVLHEYRIVVCTLSVSAKLATGKFGKDSTGSPMFSHVFVDEAGASTEAETLMGIINGLSPRASLIISGDHKQLGPILRSDRAAELGLSVSLLERLLSCCCYNVGENGDYNHHIQTRLRINYRSHPQIVRLYNSLYYNNELKALADESEVNLCERWHKAPNPKYPIIFHSVFGTSERQTNSVSLHNQRELEVVMDYVKDLMYFGINGEKIAQSDIGIISPYKSQFMRIQEQLNLRNWYEIETGSVETFQGKEKAIIIVSFVRSFTSTLGFLDNPRRLNVTISRPKALLILIGNPTTLCANPDFKYIIAECQRNDSMVGTTWRDGKSNVGEEPASSYYAKEPTNMEALHKEFEQLSTEDGTPSQIRANNQNKKAKRAAYYKKIQEANEHNGQMPAQPKLGHPMKKSVHPKSQQKQRQKFAACKKIVSKEAEEKTEMDKLFEELPKLPQALMQPNASDSSVNSQNFNNLNSDDWRSDAAAALLINQLNSPYNSQGASTSYMGQPYTGYANMNQPYGSQGASASNMSQPHAGWNQPFPGQGGYPSQMASGSNIRQPYARYGQQGMPSSNFNLPYGGYNSQGPLASNPNQAFTDYKPYEASAPNLNQANAFYRPQGNSSSNMNMLNRQGAPSCNMQASNAGYSSRGTGPSGTKLSQAANGSKAKASSNPGGGLQTKSSSTKKPLNKGNGSQATAKLSNTGSVPKSTGSSSTKSSNAANGSKANASADIKSSNPGSGSQTASSSMKKSLNNENISTASSNTKNADSGSQSTGSVGIKSSNASNVSKATLSGTKPANSASGSQTTSSLTIKPLNSGNGTQVTKKFSIAGSGLTASTGTKSANAANGAQATSSSGTKPTLSAATKPTSSGTSATQTSNARYGSQATGLSATNASHPLDQWNLSDSSTAAGIKLFNTLRQTAAAAPTNPSAAGAGSQAAGSTSSGTPYAAAQQQLNAARRQQHSFNAPRFVQPESGAGFVYLTHNARTPEVAYEAFGTGRRLQGETEARPRAEKKDKMCTIS